MKVYAILFRLNGLYYYYREQGEDGCKRIVLWDEDDILLVDAKAIEIGDAVPVRLEIPLAEEASGLENE